MLLKVFEPIGPVASIAVCRDSNTGRSLCSAYVTYSSVHDAEHAMDTLKNLKLLDRPCSLAWSQRESNTANSFLSVLYVRNLALSVNSERLFTIFSAFGNMNSCKVVTDEDGDSMGYGYVNYENSGAAQLAIGMMNGTLLDKVEVSVGYLLRRSDQALVGKEEINMQLPDKKKGEAESNFFLNKTDKADKALATSKSPVPLDQKSRGTSGGPLDILDNLQNLVWGKPQLPTTPTPTSASAQAFLPAPAPELECAVCMCPYQAAEGLACTAPIHCKTFTCWECLQYSYEAAMKPGAIQGCCNKQGELLCSNVKCRFPITVDRWAQVTPTAAVLEAQQKLKLKATVDIELQKALQLQKLQIEAEYARIEQIQNEDEKTAAKLRMKIVNEILTLSCPRCKMAFVDFDGCFALTCNNQACRCGFCAWCLEDCGADAHKHVVNCKEGSRKVHDTFANFTEHHRKKKISAVTKLIKEKRLNNIATAKLKELLRQDLSDLNIKENDMFAPAALAAAAKQRHNPPPPQPAPAPAAPPLEPAQQLWQQVFLPGIQLLEVLLGEVWVLRGLPLPIQLVPRGRQLRVWYPIIHWRWLPIWGALHQQQQMNRPWIQWHRILIPDIFHPQNRIVLGVVVLIICALLLPQTVWVNIISPVFLVLSTLCIWLLFPVIFLLKAILPKVIFQGAALLCGLLIEFLRAGIMLLLVLWSSVLLPVELLLRMLLINSWQFVLVPALHLVTAILLQVLWIALLLPKALWICLVMPVLQLPGALTALLLGSLALGTLLLHRRQ